MTTFSSLFFLTFYLVFLQVNADVAEFAVLRASTKLSKTEKYFCILYNPKWKELPTELSSTPKYEYELVPSDVLCGGGNTSKDSYNDKAVFSREDPSNTCPYSTMVKYAQERNATELVIINSDDKLFAIAKSSQNYKNSTIAVAVMKNSDYHTMEGLGDSVVVQLYVPPLAAIDSNLLVIWLLALGTVVIGAYWSGKVAIQQRDKLVEKKASSSNEKLVESDDEESPSAQVSPLMVIIFVAMICGFLLLVYYFYKYVVYVIIVIFAIASSTGMYECFNAVVIMLPFCTCKVPPNPLPVLKSEPLVKSIFVALFSLSFAVWWFIVRNGSYAWVLQDILGVVFCISLLKNLRLPSMKICTLLLVLLLIYDVFFVFITPLFSAGHNSVMVDVATGEGHKEQIPMVIKVPRIMRSALLVCGQRDYSLLGLGDILVPGLFVSFCHCYDQMAKTPYKIYYVASSIAYGCGLFITFAALYLMKEGQPALVYLVPCTLGTVFIISLIRREFFNLWNGTYLSSPPNDSNQELLSDEDEDIYQKPDNDQSIIVGTNENLSGERERLIN